MKNLSKLIALAALALLAFVLLIPVTAQAQATPVYFSNTLLSGSTVTNSTTRTYNLTIDARKQTTVGLMVSFALTGGAETGNIVVTLQRSIDGSTWESTGTTITTAANGTNTVSLVTAVASNGAGYIRLATIQNANTNNATVSVQYPTKIGAP